MICLHAEKVFENRWNSFFVKLINKRMIFKLFDVNSIQLMNLLDLFTDRLLLLCDTMYIMKSEDI